MLHGGQGLAGSQGLLAKVSLNPTTVLAGRRRRRRRRGMRARTRMHTHAQRRSINKYYTRDRSTGIMGTAAARRALAADRQGARRRQLVLDLGRCAQRADEATGARQGCCGSVPAAGGSVSDGGDGSSAERTKRSTGEL
eukprot:SAG31_NODE_6199_length_2127_cov_1.691815_3_plen_139_part_00